MMPAEVLLAQESAYDVIISETVDSRGRETGGILIGRQVIYQGNPALVVLVASGPGQSAQRSAISFAPDLDFHRAELEAWRQRYARYGVDFIGEWHKHPPGLPGPTAGDIRQAHAILDDPDYVLPHGGLLIPITQLGKEGGEVRFFYVTRGCKKPTELSYRLVMREVLEQLLDECLQAASEPSVLVAKPASSFRFEGTRVSDLRATRWGTPPSSPVRVTPSNDDHPMGRIIIGEYRVVEPEPPTDKPLPETVPVETMASQALLREIQRLERTMQPYVALQRPSGAELDYIDLVFHRPIPLPQPAESPGRAAPGDEKVSEAMPRPGEKVSGIRIAFPHNYPEADLGMWIVGEHDYPVKLEALQARGAHTLEQRVDVVLRWLTTSHPQDLTGILEANAEYLYRQGLQVVRKSVDRLDVLLKSLEDKAVRHPVIVDGGPSLV